jgi:hypothetical protein
MRFLAGALVVVSSGELCGLSLSRAPRVWGPESCSSLRHPLLGVATSACVGSIGYLARVYFATETGDVRRIDFPPTAQP